MNLSEWKNEKHEAEVLRVKTALRNGEEVVSFLGEAKLSELHEEVLIEDYIEEVYFEESIDLDEAHLDMDQKDDCNCDDDTGECECPDTFFDFIPDEFAQAMDLEFDIEVDDHYDDGILHYLNNIRDNLFADSYTVNGQDLGEDISAIEIGEAGRARIVFQRAKGKIVKRKKCKKGTRLVGNRCLPQTGTQKAKLRRVGVKLKRAQRARGAGSKKRAQIRSKITKKRVKSRSRSLANTIN